MTYTNRVDDLDLWWHLKNGQFIYETHTIPQKDYFSYTTEVPESISRIGKDEIAATEIPLEKNNWFWSINLKHSWLSEFIFYLAYLSGGFAGISVLKSTTFVLAYLILYLTMLKRGAGFLSSFFVLCLVAFIGIDFNYTRPQIFSFLSFSCLLYIFYDFRKRGKGIYFLPLLMLIWANLHGGFILGVFVMFIFTFAESLKYLLRNKFSILKITTLDKRQIKNLATFFFISFLTSLINPNGYKTLLFPFFQGRSLFATIEENLRPMPYEYHAYWFMVVLVIITVLILIRKRHMDITELFLSLVIIIPSLRSIRYIIFFALGSGVFLAYTIGYTALLLKEWGPIKRLLNTHPFSSPLSKGGYRAVKGWRGGIFSLLFAFVFLTIFARITLSGDVLKFDMGGKRYPADAVAFIKETQIPGNMFNLYNWGGYLIWHLSPSHRVFIDGRTLNETAFFHYNQILKAEKGNNPAKPLWKRLLDAYNVNFILISAVSSSGSIIPLVDMLYVSSEWELIYADGKSIIFLKNIPENQKLIGRYRFSKDKLDDEVISECEQGIKDTPATWGYYETLGYMYMKKNRFNEALTMLQKYLAMNPYDKNVRYYHDLLIRYIKEKNVEM